ncbi:hypothetical protein ABAZ39_13050 [Azospirillum argentinense]|uniref:Protein NO VEIN C-terminal domain-containing protein n=1 Tax=Azospirillum argentinense TaxID=2970906 RepID=A0A060DPU2_9PROT|nr:DUF3883 domain-containing protein [Azospirillum argentinense]AIB12899.1 hypothetical protein ABAZ39_13050 [Azospirillum argentinense]EZQ09897.1 hypothetical protein ABAZ39_14460 [Azospirillum argentinense]
MTDAAFAGGTSVFTKLTSPAAVKLAVAECKAMGRQAFLEHYGFRMAREYLLEDADGHYDSKAIAAVAFGYQHPEIGPLASNQCSGGKGHGHAGWALHRLGFAVAGMAANRNEWPLAEVEAAVDAYLGVLQRQDSGAPFSKKAVVQAVAAALGTRTEKAVEYKFLNISAVMASLGRPWVQGWAPLGNYQRLLEFVVRDRLTYGALGIGPEGPAGDPAEVFVPPPSPPTGGGGHVGPPTGRKTDWSERGARNAELGRLGEQFVLDLERARLLPLGKEPEWTVAVHGDGLGYDIRSCDADGKPILIEVKTTASGIGAPFYLTTRELVVSREHGPSYKLYRVFNFFGERRIYVLNGPLDAACALEPVSFRAVPSPHREDAAA